MNLFQRPNSKGSLVGQNWNFSLNGQRKSTGTSNKREAARIADLMMSKERSHRIAGLTEEATIGEVVSLYVARQSLLSDSSKAQVEGFGRKITGHYDMDQIYKVPKQSGKLPFFFREKRLWSSVSNRDLDALKTHRQEEGYANGTINKEFDNLAAMQKACRRYWGIKINHELDFEDIKLKTVKKFRAASEDEEQRLIDALNPVTRIYLNNCTWDRAPTRQRLWAVDTFHLLILYLDTGVRSAEGRHLLWDDVDTKNFQGIKVWRNKTKRLDMLQLTDRLAECLKSRFEYRGVRDSKYVFPHAWDTDLPRTGNLDALRSGIDRAGLNDPTTKARYGKFTVHSLRDSYATRLTEQGIVPSELMHLLGHSTEEMSMKYIHMRPKDSIAKGTKLRNSVAQALPINDSLVDAYQENRCISELTEQT